MENKNEESLIKTRSPRACVSYGFKLYMGQFKRIFLSTWWAQLAFAVVSGVAEALLVVHYPLVVAALLALWYVLYRFLLRPRLQAVLPPTQTTLKVCMRHLGPLFVVALATLMACASVWLLTSVPAVILGIANIQAETGVLYGDALGMPDYMKWLTIAVFTLSAFMQQYIYLANFFPIRYALGSIQADEAERLNALNKIQNKA